MINAFDQIAVNNLYGPGRIVKDSKFCQKGLDCGLIFSIYLNCQRSYQVLQALVLPI